MLKVDAEKLSRPSLSSVFLLLSGTVSFLIHTACCSAVLYRSQESVRVRCGFWCHQHSSSCPPSSQLLAAATEQETSVASVTFARNLCSADGMFGWSIMHAEVQISFHTHVSNLSRISALTWLIRWRRSLLAVAAVVVDIVLCFFLPRAVKRAAKETTR